MGLKKHLSAALTILFLFSLCVCFTACDVKEDKTQSLQTNDDDTVQSVISVPILMYHHFVDEAPVANTTIVTRAVFADQINALNAADYTAVTCDQIIAFVENGQPLPDNPILITMDDGYTSNITIAAPILEENGMCATVFVIGINAGQKFYAHTGNPLMPPRFGAEEAAAYINSGVLHMQGHTYDMHQLVSYGHSLRDGVLQKDEESEADYRKALADDIAKSKEQLMRDFGSELVAFAYPFGYVSNIADEELVNAGVKLTVTTQEGCAEIISGDKSSLIGMPRINVTDYISGEALVSLIEELKNK